MPVEFNIPPTMTFKHPQVEVDGEKSFVRYPPSSGDVWRAGETFRINLTSANEFLDPTRSYLKFKLQLEGVTTTSGSTAITSYLGAGACFQRVTTSISGRVIEDNSEYHSYLAAVYPKLPVAQQNMLKELELYGDQTQLTSSANAAANGYVVCHALRTGLFEGADKMFPLAFVPGGAAIEITTSELSRFLVATSSGATNFKISEVELVACLIKPDDKYLQEFRAGWESAGVPYPMTIVRNYRTHLTLILNLRDILTTP